MIDPQALLENLSTLRIPLDPGAIQSSLVSLAVSLGVHRLFQYGQRGKRVGGISGPIEVVRTPGWFKGQLGKRGISAGLADKIGTGLGLAVFGGVTYLTLENLSLPFQPWSSALLALMAAIQLEIYAKSQKGTCVGFEKGLLIEGGFYSFEKLSLEPDDNGVSFRFGKSRMVLGRAQFERNKNRIRDPILHSKFDVNQKERGGTP